MLMFKIGRTIQKLGSYVGLDFKKEFFLAGGIDSTNASEAIERFNPYAIDLSSSLETDGFKDENKIKEIDWHHNHRQNNS